MKQSEPISNFLSYVESCRAVYAEMQQAVENENKVQQDLLHDIEFEPLAKNRNKLATQLHQSRQRRRKYKDALEEIEPIVDLFGLQQHNATLNQLQQALGKVRKAEKYHENRTYFRRSKEESNAEKKEVPKTT